MDITLYTTHCSNCKVLESMLAKKQPSFKTVDDITQVLAFADKNKQRSVPLLKANNRIMTFIEAMKWIGEIENAKQ